MAARYCFKCQHKFPLEVTGICPVCKDEDVKLAYFHYYEPDTTWRSDAGLESAPEPLPLSAHPEVDNATVIYRSDLDALIVSRKDLARLGYIPEWWDIVKLNGKYYELMEYEKETGFWTIRQFNSTDWANTALGDIPITFKGDTRG